ncbi:MAG: hypothetical protein SFY56_01210 [Bacteroidota bacterium]|nr:hypothetical protein [Bacteroidota bacterium]
MITITQSNDLTVINIEFYLVNQTGDASINLFILASALKRQIEAVYNIMENNLLCIVSVQPLYKYKLKDLTRKLIFAVSNSITNDNVAEAYFCGNMAKINVNQIQAIISNQNVRTIPHEVGHLLGLDHPHARAKYNSVNEQAHELERNMTEEERGKNLMSQTWYIQKAGKRENEALNLTKNQVALIIENYKKNRLNKNFTLRKTWFGWKWNYA